MVTITIVIQYFQSALSILSHLVPRNYEIGIILILQIRKLKPHEM